MIRDGEIIKVMVTNIYIYIPSLCLVAFVEAQHLLLEIKFYIVKEEKKNDEE